MVHWLGLHAFTAKGVDSVPGWEIKILQTMQYGQKEKQQKKFCVCAMCQTVTGKDGTVKVLVCMPFIF